MNIEIVEIERLKAYPLNAKKHPELQIQGIAESIQRFGFTQPVVVDQNYEIIIGHGRVSAAKKLGLKQVPVVRREDLRPNEIKALRLIDNRIAESDWDGDMLALDLEELDFDFSPFHISFEDLLPPDLVTGGLTDPDAVPELPEIPKTKVGEIFKLGNHRLMCGDATKTEDVQALLAGVVPTLMVTDPPYGVSYDPEWRHKAVRPDGKVYGGSKVKPLQNDDRADWQEAWEAYPGDIAYVWSAPGPLQIESFRSLINAGFEIRQQIVWIKTHHVLGRGHYHYQHEPCWYAVRKGKTGNWCGDRSQSSVWQIHNEKIETGHGAQKPIQCMLRPILNNSSQGQVIYDPFLGSGTTLIAAEDSGRICYGLEIDPAYCDVILERWESFSGKKAEKVQP